MGIVYYEMLFGRLPFSGYDAPSMMDSILNHCVNLGGISDSSANFFKQVFVAIPADRISWSELYTHELITSGTSLVEEDNL